ncbi:MAG: hypothetical protein AABY22_13600 [Nanoarchaeota archaeon]
MSKKRETLSELFFECPFCRKSLDRNKFKQYKKYQCKHCDGFFFVVESPKDFFVLSG